MPTHAPADYHCPFCRFARGEESPHNARADIVYQDDEVLAFVAPRTWPRNAGNVLVVPRAHHENLYDLPDELLARVAILAKWIAVAMKTAYRCEGRPSGSTTSRPVTRMSSTITCMSSRVGWTTSSIAETTSPGTFRPRSGGSLRKSSGK